ncbi:MAG: VWA domain-containing protein [Myxococcota bacterium]|jgi:hypothetical protein|nr:VWA domain-containing protein [Myxococcota bacterium]
MGLSYKTSTWLDRLWSEHLELSETGRVLVKQGINKQGEAFAGFPADIHARLYLPSEPEANSDEAPEWATRLHGLATETAEWTQLKLMTARNGFAAAIAAEVVLEQLLPHVPEREQGASAPPQPAPSDSDLRAALRQAARTARDTVRSVEADLEGLTGPLGLRQPGSVDVPGTKATDLAAMRALAERLRKSDMLRHISRLAGRLERVAAAKAQSKVRPGVGEIYGVGPCDDLSRLLPSELVCLGHPVLKKLMLARFIEKQTLGYEMIGREPLSRGPVIVLLDESSSMRDEGKDIWSKAVALALLSTATKEKRHFYLVAFSASLRREVSIEPGKATLDDIAKALDSPCAGGTDFDLPLQRAAELLRTSPKLRNADVILITDGEAGLAPETVATCRGLTKAEGVSWWIVGIGSQAASTCTQTLAPIATTVVAIADTRDSDDLIAPVIALGEIERR